MKINPKTALAIAAIALLLLLAWNSKAERSRSSNWEYKVVTMWGHLDAPVQNVKQFNDIGEEGWELVTVISEDVLRGNLRETKLTCYFKRPA